MKTKILLIAALVLFFSCSTNQKKKSDISYLINDSITTSVGKFELIDSTSIQINNDIKYHVWIVRTNDNGCICQLFILKEENKQLAITDTNNFIVDCSSAEYSNIDVKSLPFNIQKEDGKFVILNINDAKYTLSFDPNGAYVDIINLYRKIYKEDEVGEEEATTNYNEYGKVRVKDLTEASYNKLRFVFHNIGNRDTDALYEKYLINKNIENLKLPFSLESFLDDFYNSSGNFEKQYPSSEATDILKEFINSKTYEGEEYKCFLIPYTNDILVLMTKVIRGDSEYYLLITADKDKFIDWKEIGVTGDETTYFVIDKDILIEKYKKGNNKKIIISKLSLNDRGEIIIIK